MNKISIISLFLLLHFIGYSQKYLEGEKILFEKKSNYILPLNNKISYKERFYYNENTKEPTVFCSPIRRNVVFVYDYKSKKFLKEINIPKEGPDGIGMSQFIHFHNFDSIFSLGIFRPFIYLHNDNGKLDKKYNLTTTEGSFNFIAAATYSFPLFYKQGFLYFMQINDYEWQKAEHWLTPQGIILDINKNKIYGQIMAYPYVHTGGVFDYQFSGLVLKNNEIVASFPKSHNLFLYSKEKLLKNYYIKSKYLPQKIRMPESDLSEDRVRAKKYTIESGSYFNIKYDLWRNYIYRIVNLPTDFTDSDGHKQDLGDRAFSIQIIDATTFELIDEILFPKYKYDVNNIIPVPEGILISTSNEGNPDLEEDNIVFELFKIVKQ